MAETAPTAAATTPSMPATVAAATACRDPNAALAARPVAGTGAADAGHVLGGETTEDKRG